MNTIDKMRALRICSQILGKICDNWEQEKEEWAEVVKCQTEEKAMFITNLIDTAIRPCLPAEVKFGIFKGEHFWEVSLSYRKDFEDATVTVSAQSIRADN